MPQDPSIPPLTSAIYYVPYPDGATKALYSMADFYDVIVDFCVATCMFSMATDPAYQEIVHGEGEPSIEAIGPLVDALIPDESQAGSLFTFVSFDLGLWTSEPEDYDKDNSHAPAALVYENLYRETVNFIQAHWQEITLLVKDNLCEVCWKHQWQWLWYPFTSSNPFVHPRSSDHKVLLDCAISVGCSSSRCKQSWETISPENIRLTTTL